MCLQRDHLKRRIGISNLFVKNTGTTGCLSSPIFPNSHDLFGRAQVFVVEYFMHAAIVDEKTNVLTFKVLMLEIVTGRLLRHPARLFLDMHPSSWAKMMMFSIGTIFELSVDAAELPQSTT